MSIAQGPIRPSSSADLRSDPTHVAELSQAYEWVGPLPEGRIDDVHVELIVELLETLDGLLSSHPDAMLDIVDVVRSEGALRLYYRLTRTKAITDNLEATVATAIRSTETRSGKMG